MNNPLVVVPLDDLRSIIAQSLAQELEKLEKPKKESIQDDHLLITRKETAKLLNVCLATLDNWTREGKLIKYRNGNVVRYKKKEVLASFSTLIKYRR